MSGRLQDRIAIVTGAGCVGPGWGNGRATCVRFAEEGAKIFAVDRNLDSVIETVERVKAAGGEIVTHQCDVTGANSVEIMAPIAPPPQPTRRRRVTLPLYQKSCAHSSSFHFSVIASPPSGSHADHFFFIESARRQSKQWAPNPISLALFELSDIAERDHRLHKVKGSAVVQSDPFAEIGQADSVAVARNFFEDGEGAAN